MEMRWPSLADFDVTGHPLLAFVLISVVIYEGAGAKSDSCR
jgi:hypothetical protein